MSSVPALVDQATWDAAHAALAKRLVVRHEAGSAATRDAYLLRGQLTCGHCGGPLACNLGRGKGQPPLRYYTCRHHSKIWATRNGRESCPLPAVPTESMDAAAWGVISKAVMVFARGEGPGLVRERDARMLTEEQYVTLSELAAKVGVGAERIAAPDRRRIVQLLDVRGSVRCDPEGAVRGRRHAFRVDWEAILLDRPRPT